MVWQGYWKLVTIYDHSTSMFINKISEIKNLTAANPIPLKILLILIIVER